MLTAESHLDVSLRDIESDMLSNSVEPSLQKVDLTMAAHAMKSNLEPIFAYPRPQGIERITDVTEPTLAPTDLEEFELSTTSSIGVRVDRTKMASKQDWIRLRPEIKRLYVDENKTLKEVMSIIEREHGLKAT